MLSLDLTEGPKGRNMVIICNLPRKTVQKSCQCVKSENEILVNSTRKVGSSFVPTRKSQKRFAAKLRKLRWEAYHEEEESKVKKILEKYKTMIGEFMVKFKTTLKTHEVDIWKEKLNQTVKDTVSPKKSDVKGKSYAMVNSLWSGGSAQNVMNFKSLKKKDVPTPDEIMRKLDDVLLKLDEIKCLLNGKDVPSKFVGNNGSMKGLDTEKVLDDKDKTEVVVDETLGNVDDEADNHSDVGGKDTHFRGVVAIDVSTGDAERVLDVNPHRMRKMKLKKSIVTSEVAAMGKYAYKVIDARDQIKAVGDALDAVDDEVGGGSAATVVHNVVGGKDAKVDDAAAREDATEEVLGIDSHARRQGFGRRPVLDKYEVTGKGNDAYEDIEDEAKAVEDALDDVDDEVGGGSAAADVQDVVGGKDYQSIDAVAKEDVIDAAEEDLGIDLHAKCKVTGREFTPEITTGDTAYDEEVGDGDAAYDINELKNESRSDEVHASIQLMMKRNPVRNFGARCVARNAQDCVNLARKYWELKRSHQLIPSNLIDDVGCYMVEAARELGNVEVKTEGEKKVVKIALMGIINCIRSLI